jgi:hypothetical protein
MLLWEQSLFNVPPKILLSSNNLLGIFACDVFGPISKKIKEYFRSLNISFSFLVVPFHSIFGVIIYILGVFFFFFDKIIKFY